MYWRFIITLLLFSALAFSGYGETGTITLQGAEPTLEQPATP